MCHRARRRSLALPAVVALLVPAPANSGQGELRPLPPFEASRVEFARAGAIERLRAPECRAVLDEFRDAQGRPLSSRLAALNLRPEEYLAMIPFLDGRGRPGCADGTSELRTAIGIPRVFVCRPFLRTVNRERMAAEVYVIHEMLHTLGLGENPPTSAYIADRVRKRCGSLERRVRRHGRPVTPGLNSQLGAAGAAADGNEPRAARSTPSRTRCTSPQCFW